MSIVLRTYSSYTYPKTTSRTDYHFCWKNTQLHKRLHPQQSLLSEVIYQNLWKPFSKWQRASPNSLRLHTQ